MLAGWSQEPQRLQDWAGGCPPTRMALYAASLDVSHHHSREDGIVPASCLLASLHDQPQRSGFWPRPWCRLSSSRTPGGFPAGTVLGAPRVDLLWTS